MPNSEEPITPALTPDEWVEFGDSKPFFERLAGGGRPFGPHRRFTDEQKMHALAALALHRHPAVPTFAELDAVEAAAGLFERRRGLGDLALASNLRALHRKVSALLPPRDVRIAPID